ncbi:O-fucosyltransferase family protein [Niallia sp. 01092]|uniref:O-fucosyltransferase family protein n=1 Tax=unclassified Niallia TaxID=2837522 RepID=UPI003FD344D4
MHNERFLLIKAYSNSFWMDIHQLMEQLLIAEISNRIPVVHWGANHLLDGTKYQNAFDMYFEPISPYTIYHLMHPSYTFYPSVWDYNNLMMNNDDDRKTLAHRNIGEMLNSDANVVVCDTYSNKFPVTPFIKPEHSVFGMTPLQIHRFLFQKYLKLKPDIEEEINQFYDAHFKDEGPILGVHVRGKFTINEFSDEFDDFNEKYHSKMYNITRGDEHNSNAMVKLHEIHRIYKVKDLEKPNHLYHQEIRQLLGKYNIKKLFLSTDCIEVVEEYKRLYGPMLVVTDCSRHSINDEEAPYIDTHMTSRSDGIEVLKETYLATKCDFFIGNGLSNLSHAVTQLKDWSSTNIKLIYWLPEKKNLHNYKQVNTIVYPDNEFVGWFKQLLFRISRLWHRKGQN